MAFADASETRVAYIEEVTFGTTPATPTFLVTRVTGETLIGDQQTVVSNELRSDAEVADLVKVGESGSGGLPFELNFGTENHTLLEHALRGSFAAETAATGVRAMSTTAPNIFSDAGNGFITDGFKVGMQITTTDFTDGANNGTFHIIAVAAGSITIGEQTLVTEGAGADETITANGSRLVAGVEKLSVTLEKTHETGSPDSYFRYAGARMASFSLSVVSQQIITGNMEWLALGETLGTAIISGATYTAANTNPVMAAPDVGLVSVGGVASTVVFSEFSFNLTNNLRAQNGIGSIPASGIGYGRREITGTLTAFFEDADVYEEAVNNNTAAVIVPVTDGTNYYILTLPAVKFSSRAATAGGNNQDIVANLGFQAILDTTAGASITIVHV